ncbi:MAG: hypothetical protein ABSA03_16315, partial [Streptosporangiaceae bacterium]
QHSPGPHRSPRSRQSSRPWRFALLLLWILIAASLAVAGCASAGSHPAGHASGTRARTDKVTSCGTTRTAANVPVRVHIQHGPASCGIAMSVERRYARAILAGKAPGNGGGGPVHINGWTCQGFPTPTVLASGKASKCVKGAAEILAILPAPA